MNEIDFIVLCGAAVLAGGFFCRLNLLYIRTHRAEVVAFHFVFFGGCFWAGVDAWLGHLTLAHGCFLAAAALWLLISLPTWRHGPPDHVSSDWGRLESRSGEVAE